MNTCDCLDHIWHWRSRLPERKGQPCRVLVRGGQMNSIIVQFGDGSRVVTSRYAVRRVIWEVGQLLLGV